MEILPRACLLFSLFALTFGTVIAQVEENSAPTLFSDRVVVVKIRSDDLIDASRIRQLEQLLSRAEKEKASALIFDLNVKGDLPWNLQESVLESLSHLSVPTIAFINPTATGAGALIAAGSEKIYLSSNGIVGGAGIALSDRENSEAQKRELAQQLSLLKARARSLAKTRGHREEIVEAFIDSDLEVSYSGQIISPKGAVLTLTAEEAIRVFDGRTLFATGISSGIEDILVKENLTAEVVRMTPREFIDRQNRERLKGKSDPKPKAEEAEKEEPGIFSREHGKSYEGKVVVLKVGDDALSTGKAMFEFMDRTLKKAQLDEAKAVVFELDTPGGIAWYTQGLLLNSLQDVSIPTFSFVNTRAESAGAIIALGTDAIYMRPAATIGSALIVSGTGADLPGALESKATQMIISVVRNMAEIKGHNPDVAEAFVTREKEVKIGGIVIHKPGEVLNLNTTRATEVVDGTPVLAKGVANSIEDLISQEGITGEIVDAEFLGLETFAHWIQKYAALLLIIGIAGVYLELKTPGFSLPGAIGLLAFALYFFGNNLAGNLAGYELAVLFGLGLVLIGVEIFLFPGLMIPALAGGTLVVLSLGFAMVDRVDFEWKWEGLPGSDSNSWADLFRGSFSTVGFGIIGGALIVLGIMRLLPKSRFGNLLILKEAVPSGASIDGQFSAQAPGEVLEKISYLGWEGASLTDLRPAGKGRFQGQVLDIITDGEFIPQTSLVKVIKHEGSRIVVKRITT